MSKFYLTIGIAAMLLMGCSKDLVDEASDDISQEETTSGISLHEVCDSLIHVAAVEVTDSTMGNIEYWQCPYCLKRYHDADMRDELTESPIILPKHIKAMYSSFAGCKGLDSIYYNQSSTRALVGVDDWIDTGNIDGVDNLVGVAPKVDGTSIASLAISVISTIFAVAFESVSMGGMDASEQVEKARQNVSDIQSSIENINRQLAEMNTILNSLAMNISSLVDYADAIDKRLDGMESLQQQTMGTLLVLIAYTKAYTDSTSKYNDLANPENRIFGDSTKYRNLCYSAIQKWGEYKTANKINKNLNDTKEYLRLYADMGSASETESFPAVLKKFSEKLVTWEHEAYAYRSIVLNRDLVIMYAAHAFDSLYYERIAEKNTINNNEMTALNEAWKDYIRIYNEDDSIRKINYESFRYNLKTGQKINIKYGTSETVPIHSTLLTAANDKSLPYYCYFKKTDATDWLDKLDTKIGMKYKTENYLTPTAIQCIYDMEIAKGKTGGLYTILSGLGLVPAKPAGDSREMRLLAVDGDSFKNEQNDKKNFSYDLLYRQYHLSAKFKCQDVFGTSWLGTQFDSNVRYINDSGEIAEEPVYAGSLMGIEGFFSYKSNPLFNLKPENVKSGTYNYFAIKAAK